MRNRIKYLVTVKNTKLDDYVDKWLKVKINYYANLFLVKTFAMYNVVILIRFIHSNEKKHCPWAFVEESLYKLAK